MTNGRIWAWLALLTCNLDLKLASCGRTMGGFCGCFSLALLALLCLQATRPVTSQEGCTLPTNNTLYTELMNGVVPTIATVADYHFTCLGSTQSKGRYVMTACLL